MRVTLAGSPQCAITRWAAVPGEACVFSVLRCVLVCWGVVLQGVGLRFEAEATGWLQNKNIPMTNDAAKYDNKDATAKVLAILTPGRCAVRARDVAVAACGSSWSGTGAWCLADRVPYGICFCMAGKDAVLVCMLTPLTRCHYQAAY